MISEWSSYEGRLVVMAAQNIVRLVQLDRLDQAFTLQTVAWRGMMLFHCKFSGSENAGARIADLYVVCGQAQKGVSWTLGFTRLAEHIIHRETKTLGGRPTRFERGGLKELHRIERACRKSPPEYFMTVVQPGVSRAVFDAEHSAILGATSLFLRQRLSTTLSVWTSA
jgi:hypothetical protein